MGYASRSGRAKTSATNPQAHAICDRCGFRYNFVELSWQYEWRGATLQNIRILVCPTCMDQPQENVRSIVLPADPTPIINARVQDFNVAEVDYIQTTPGTTDPTTGLPVPSGVVVTTADTGLSLNKAPIGSPAGEQLAGQMPLVNAIQWDQPLAMLSLSSNGTKTVTGTTSGPHGLSTGSQIGVQGTPYKGSNGIFSVTALTATAFSYITGVVVPAASLLGSTTIVATANIGIPQDYTQVPQPGA